MNHLKMYKHINSQLKFTLIKNFIYFFSFNFNKICIINSIQSSFFLYLNFFYFIFYCLVYIANKLFYFFFQMIHIYVYKTIFHNFLFFIKLFIFHMHRFNIHITTKLGFFCFIIYYLDIRTVDIYYNISYVSIFILIINI